MKFKGASAQLDNPAKNNSGGWRSQIVCLPFQSCICEEVRGCLKCDLEECRLAALNPNSAAGSIAALQQINSSGFTQLLDLHSLKPLLAFASTLYQIRGLGRTLQ